MKKILERKISINNEYLIGGIALVFAIAVFTFWRIFLGINPIWQIMPSQMQKTANLAAPLENAASTEKQIYPIPILMYHHIGGLPPEADAVRADLTVSAQNFELQVAWLKSQGYQSISLSGLSDLIKNKEKIPEKTIIFTFDDGYAETLQNAPEILKNYGFTGSFAIITQFPGIDYGTNQYATWQQIKQAKAMGMEIVSHTQDHFDGTDKKYDEAFILRNLSDSKKDIKNNLGIDTNILVYPFGHYDKRYIQLARQAGFEMGITTQEGSASASSSLMEITRLRVHGQESLEIFQKLFEAKK